MAWRTCCEFLPNFAEPVALISMNQSAVLHISHLTIVSVSLSTVDLLYAQCWMTLVWWNPGIWFEAYTNVCLEMRGILSLNLDLLWWNDTFHSVPKISVWTDWSRAPSYMSSLRICVWTTISKHWRMVCSSCSCAAFLKKLSPTNWTQCIRLFALHF